MSHILSRQRWAQERAVNWPKRAWVDDLLLTRWRGHCAHLLVDEVQDVDKMQLQLALTLAAPANRIFLVGDDDQSLY